MYNQYTVVYSSVTQQLTGLSKLYVHYKVYLKMYG